MFGDFWGSCENHRFLSPIGESTFWTTFKKLCFFLFQHLVTLLKSKMKGHLEVAFTVIKALLFKAVKREKT